jgi:hypothetical protein
VLVKRRALWAVLVSVALHVLAVAAVLGSSLWRGWPAIPVDVEIAAMKLEELKDLPLGSPATAEQPSSAVVVTSHHVPIRVRAPKSRRVGGLPKDELTHASRHPDAGVDGAGAADAGTGGPRPGAARGVQSYGPTGSRVTALMRVDRLRGSPYAPVVDALLLHLPDRRDLLEGTGVDLYRDIDAVLIATPNPLDAAVTFLAARHRLSDSALRAALEKGAHATGRKLSWRNERGRPFAERRFAGGAGAPGNRDQRLILLAAPHLVVVTPPAYRSLILRGGGTAAPAPSPARDGGTPEDGGGGNGEAGGDGGSPARAGEDGTGWAALLRRIDAEDSVMPPDAVAMVSASDLFSARGLRATMDVAPGTRGAVDLDAPGGSHDAPGGSPPTATVLGLPVPRVLTATLGIAPQPFADIGADFTAEGDALRWEQEWPTLRHKLLTNPLVVLTGFSALIGRVTLDRQGLSVHLHVDATELETIRLLELAAAQLAAMGR